MLLLQMVDFVPKFCKLCALCGAFEDYVPRFCQLYTSYVHHLFRFYCLFFGIFELK